MEKIVDFERLQTFLRRVPGVSNWVGKCTFDDGTWWVKFRINIAHPLAWNVVQSLGQVLNYLSIKDRLPTVFKPVSPPPYMNGGPGEFLSWVIESLDPEFEPDMAAEWLEGRLPKPVDDEGSWNCDDAEDDEQKEESGKEPL